MSRRGFFAQVIAAAALPVAGGYYATQVEPFWPRFPEIVVRIKGLGKSFENFRIAQVTDMHTGHTQTEFLQSALTHVESLKPDLVLFTGDLIHHNSDWIGTVAKLVKTFSMPVVASFGNHDYSPYRGADEPFDPDLSDKLIAALGDVGCPVLRNESKVIERNGERLWLVGLDDLWFGEFRPRPAFEKIPAGEPVIALSHNPDTAEMLGPYHPDLILSGHTHGGQLRLPFYGAIRLNVAQPQYDWGLFQLPSSQLYVSSGIGFILQARFNCRPEVPIIILRNG
jgi:predicted MPP superfamily phosphohydrolase